MKKKSIGILLLLCLLPSLLPAQEPISSVERISQIVDELEIIQKEKESYYQNLESINEERLNELNEREQELLALKRNLELFGNLIDDQAIYTKSLEKKLTFWRITSGVLATSLMTMIVVRAASK